MPSEVIASATVEAAVTVGGTSSVSVPFRLIEYCESHEIVCPNFVKGFKPPRARKTLPKWFTMAQVKRLLEAAQGTKWLPVVALGAYGSMRRGEIDRCMWEDVKFDDGYVIVKAEKTATERAVPISPLLKDILLPLRQSSGFVVERGWLWNYSRHFRALCITAGVPQYSLHKLRHSFASNLLGMGATLLAVKAAGGWSSLATVNRYAHAAADDVKAALALFK